MSDGPVTQLILTAVGADKPGLVGDLTGHLHAAGANIVDSRMVNLRGQFAVIVLVEGDAGSLGGLQKKLPEMGTAVGLQLTSVAHTTSAPVVAGVPYRLKTYSADQPGIVHAISDVLRQSGVNIEDLAARQESAPFAGSTLFTMELRITVPATVSVRTLRHALEAACERLNCDLDMEPA